MNPYLLLVFALWKTETGPAYTGTVKVAEFATRGLVAPALLKVRVYLPPGYSPQGHYPVLYATDGQNGFQGGQYGDWHFDEVAQRMILAKQIPPIMIVTVDAPNGDFRQDYYTARRTWDRSRKAEIGGKAEQYAQFLVGLKAKVDHDFATDPGDAAVLGSSLGGLFSVYAGYAHPEVFGRVAALSPSFWWAGRPGTGELVSRAALTHPPRRVWIDIGDQESFDPDPCEHKVEAEENVQKAQAMAEWLTSGGAEVHYQCYRGAGHNEKSWSERLPSVLEWLYRDKR
jgi:predicted alpha/beta superfamily hydrolase